MKEITKAKKLTHRSSLLFMLTATLPLMILLLIGGVFYTSKMEENTASCQCVDAGKEEDISFLRAMPFPLLPALEVTYAAPVNSLLK